MNNNNSHFVGTRNKQLCIYGDFISILISMSKYVMTDYSKGLLLLGIALIIGLAISIAVIVTIKYMMQSKRSRRKMESQLDSAFNGNVEAETMRLIASDSDEG